MKDHLDPHGRVNTWNASFVRVHRARKRVKPTFRLPLISVLAPKCLVIVAPLNIYYDVRSPRNRYFMYGRTVSSPDRRRKWEKRVLCGPTSVLSESIQRSATVGSPARNDLGRRIQSQRLATDRFKVRELVEGVVVHGRLAIVSVDNLGPESLLYIWVLRKKVDCARKHVRRRIHAPEDQDAMRYICHPKDLWSRLQRSTHDVCATISSSVSFSASDATILYLTARPARRDEHLKQPLQDTGLTQSAHNVPSTAILMQAGPGSLGECGFLLSDNLLRAALHGVRDIHQPTQPLKRHQAQNGPHLISR